MDTTPDPRRIEAAFETLNDLMGEIHAGRTIGIAAEVIGSEHVQYIHRIAEGAIAIALRKFQDLWKHQIVSELVADDPPKDGVDLARELTDRKVRNFANLMVAHYAPSPDAPKISETEREEIIKAMGFETSAEFYQWCGKAIERIETVRNRLKDLLGKEGV